MTEQQEKTKIEVDSLKEKIKLLQTSIYNCRAQIEGLERDMEQLNVLIRKERKNCTHSYARAKSKGVAWYDLGKCIFCGESDY